MDKITKIKLLSLLAIFQVLTIIGGFITYQQMFEMLWNLQIAYKDLVEKTGGPIVDFGIIPNPFAPFFLLALLGLFLTIVSLIDEVRHKNVEN